MIKKNHLPVPGEPEILFEDKHLIVVSKPAGLLSQGDASGTVSLIDLLREYTGRFYIGMIHRLDRNVSGVMVVAKRTKAASRLSEALREGKLERFYRAWLVGHITQPQVWKHFLFKDEKQNKVHVFRRAHQGAKEAVLRIKPLRLGIWKKIPLTLAEFILETGRSHQIRVQASASGYPILGDYKYIKDKEKAGRLFSRPALHSYRLIFPHPMTGEVLEFYDDLPEDMRSIESQCTDVPGIIKKGGV